MKSNIIFRCSISLATLLVLAQPSFATSPIRSWATDMYNQLSVKPQAEGTVLAFPVGSITTKGIIMYSDGVKNAYADSLPWADYDPKGFRYNPNRTPTNPLKPEQWDDAKGAYLYNVYCAACHGDDGLAQTKVGQLRGALPIKDLVPKYSEGYIFTKMTYGGPAITSMPPFGYSLSEQERWVLAHFVKKKFQ